MEKYIKRSLIPVLLTQYCSGDQIENEMGGECSAYRGEERRAEGFDEKPEGKTNWKTLV